MCARSCLAGKRWPMLLRNSQSLPLTMGITLSGVAVVRMQGNRGYTVTEDRISTHQSKHKQPLPNTVRRFLKIAGLPLGVLGTGSRHLAKSGNSPSNTAGSWPDHPKDENPLWRKASIPSEEVDHPLALPPPAKSYRDPKTPA